MSGGPADAILIRVYCLDPIPDRNQTDRLVSGSARSESLAPFTVNDLTETITNTTKSVSNNYLHNLLLDILYERLIYPNYNV